MKKLYFDNKIKRIRSKEKVRVLKGTNKELYTY